MSNIQEIIKSRSKNQQVKDFFFLFIGIAIYSFGYTAFILPEKVVMGGVAGLSALIFYATGLPTGISIWALNITMLAIAFRP